MLATSEHHTLSPALHGELTISPVPSAAASSSSTRGRPLPCSGHPGQAGLHFPLPPFLSPMHAILYPPPVVLLPGLILIAIFLGSAFIFVTMKASSLYGDISPSALRPRPSHGKLDYDPARDLRRAGPLSGPHPGRLDLSMLSSTLFLGVSPEK